MRRDKRRYHHHSPASIKHTAVHIVAQRLTVATLSGADPHTAHVNSIIALCMQQGYITHAIIAAVSYPDAFLHTEESGYQALRCQTLGVHIQIAYRVLQLGIAAHRAYEGHLRKQRQQAVIGIVAQLCAKPRSQLLQPGTSLFQLLPSSTRNKKRRPSFFAQAFLHTSFFAFPAFALVFAQAFL